MNLITQSLSQWIFVSLLIVYVYEINGQINYRAAINDGLWWDDYDAGTFVKTQYGDIKGFRFVIVMCNNVLNNFFK